MSLPSSLNQWFEAVAFWFAIILAFGYPGFLVAIEQGILPTSAFFLIVIVHILCLIAGRWYTGSRHAGQA